ncbi:MAG: DUF115 domain-containing protein [Chlamydiae bacterium]|nr:DUF115 domain-containing protein [Chlamydiota bacterium]
MQVIERLIDKNPFLGWLVRIQQEQKKVIYEPKVFSEKELILFDGVEWLQSLPDLIDKEVIFVEEEVSKIRGVLEDPVFEMLLSAPNVTIATERKFPFFLGGKKFEVFTKGPSRLFRNFVEDAIHFEALHQEGKNLGLSHFRNVFHSLLTFPKFSLMSSLKGDFHAPWLIVGGALMEKETLKLIEEAKKTHWVIAAGSAAKNLMDAGIRPDFATLIDPDPEASKYAEHAIPTFFQLRAKTEFLQMCKGDLIWAGQNNLYPFEQDVANWAGLPDLLFEGGYDTLNFCVRIAVYLGAASIELVGVSDERKTLNDFYSRLDLEEWGCKNFQGGGFEKDLVKKYEISSLFLDHESLKKNYQRVAEANDIVEWTRLGLMDGYVRPLEIYLGKKEIQLEPIQRLAKEALIKSTALKKERD